MRSWPALVAALSLAVPASAVRSDTLGRMLPGYAVADNDPRLASVAREAVPLVAAIDAFARNHGVCPRPDPPGDLTEFRAAIAGSYTAERQGRFLALGQPQSASKWLYQTSNADPAVCSLWRKLGWDPALIWRRSGDGAGWVFDPGDGRDERPIRFDFFDPPR